MPNLVEIVPVVLHGEKDENVQSLQADGWTDGGQSIRKLT